MFFAATSSASRSRVPHSKAVHVRWRLVAAAGIIAGIVYTVSPTTFCFLLLLPLLFAWAQRGLGPRERRWVLGLLGLAVVARVIALSGFFLSVDHLRQPY